MVEAAINGIALWREGQMREIITGQPTQGLTRVYLIGSLGRALGREIWDLDVMSVSEALRAIDINTRGGLEKYLRGPGAKRHYKIALQKKTNLIDIKEEGHNRSGRSTIYIMPTIRGRNEGWQKIAAGVVVLALAYFTGGLSVAGGAGWAGAGATATSGVTLGFAGSLAVGFGVSLVLGGITQMLTPTARGANGDSAEQKNSTTFQGNAIAVVQGARVPVIYGRALVTPIPVSITIDNDDLSTTSAGDEGVVEETGLEGGGIQYS